MTEAHIRACFRLGVAVYLRSPRTGRVWVIQPSEHTPSGQHTHLRGYPSPIHGYSGHLTPKQVQWHLTNKPTNFTTDPLNQCDSGSTTTNP